MTTSVDDVFEVSALLGHQRIQGTAGLPPVSGDLGHALLVAIQLFQHDHGKKNVVFFKLEQADRIVQQHVGVQHEQAADAVDGGFVATRATVAGDGRDNACRSRGACVSGLLTVFAFSGQGRHGWCHRRCRTAF